MSVVHSINVSEHSDRRVFSQSATQAPGRAILGEDRKLQFKYMRFVMYYICDLLKILGPLHGYFIAPLFWGKEGAKSMDYWPTTTRRALLTWLVGWPLLELLLVVVPLVEAVMVLMRARDSAFYPLAQGIFPLLFWLWPPLASACKYSLMNTQRFRLQVLKLQPQTGHVAHSQSLSADRDHESVSAPQRKVNTTYGDHLDMTEDGINTWTREIEDDVIARQLQLALWRTGGLDDGSIVMALANGSTETLGTLLQRTVARHRVAPEFRAVKKRQVAAVTLLLPLACIPNIYRWQTGGPFFGSDTQGIFTSVCTIISIVTFADYVFFWGLGKTAGHLRRAREIENEWSNLLLLSFQRSTDASGSDDGGITPVAKIDLSPENVRLWARGRDALLNFGHGYWLRLSLITAVMSLCVAILMAVLLVELLVRILERNSTNFTIGPFHLVTGAFCLIFMYFMAQLVRMAMSITSARADLRTSLLRLAAWRSQTAEIRGALRDASDVILSEETFSGQLNLLGVPLDVSLLHMMFSSLVFVVIGFYQEMVKVNKRTSTST